MIQLSEGQSLRGAGLPGEDISDSYVLADALWHTGFSQPWLGGTACVISESVAGTRCSCPGALR